MIKSKPSIVTVFLCLLISPAVNAGDKEHTSPKEEIIYHVFQRSFYDSNGDRHGDLNGIRQKLDYLQQLGVTAILLTPLYESVFYHNYFSSDFKKIDPKYGTMKDYLLLIKDLHERGMKFYMDMETQYVTEDHIWWKDGINNPKSKYSDYIIYDNATHTKPTSIIFNLKGLRGYDGVYRRITTVNLNNPKVVDYNYRLFKFWMDPNNDGKFDDGVDGFRLDHMMDNLDNKATIPHSFDTFWKPLLSRLRKVNPKINVVAEQANWESYGEDYLTHGGADRVFAFKLAFAIRSFKKDEIAAAADSTFQLTPTGKQQVIFLENHDTPRFSYSVNGELAKLKIGAALNLLLGGIPSIYYGQELGMTGISLKLGSTDANDIPVRSAFKWFKNDDAMGMANWYKIKGPWKDQFKNDRSNDGISLEEEKNDPNSLWNFYRTMIGLRKSNPVLIGGSYKTLTNNNDYIFSFKRAEGGKKIIVAVNLSDQNQDAVIQPASNVADFKSLYGDVKTEAGSNEIVVNLPAYGIGVWSAE